MNNLIAYSNFRFVTNDCILTIVVPLSRPVVLPENWRLINESIIINTASNAESRQHTDRAP